MRVFCRCPANIATGGPELLHQFCWQLNQIGVECYMIYDNNSKTVHPTPNSFLKYQVQYVSEYIDAPDSVLVLPETKVHESNCCQKGTLMIWWLSVDFYKQSYELVKLTQDSGWDVYDLKEKENVIHFVQSYYAKKFVQKELGIEESYFLGDYINDDIITSAQKYSGAYERLNVGLYNPRKGLEKLEPIFQQCRQDIQWVPLRGFTPEQMAEVMCQAKVYVDFGFHPGKDRIPREAAICGCCVVTNREGSAFYQEDVPIPDQYKVDDTSNVEAALNIIYELVDSYEDKIVEYEEYRRCILNEKQEFVNGVREAVLLLEKRTEKQMKKYPFINKNDYANNYASLESAGQMILTLFDQSSRQIKEQNLSDAMQKMYQADYLLQILRESMYLQMQDMVTIYEE